MKFVTSHIRFGKRISITLDSHKAFSAISCHGRIVEWARASRAPSPQNEEQAAAGRRRESAGLPPEPHTASTVTTPGTALIAPAICGEIR